MAEPSARTHSICRSGGVRRAIILPRSLLNVSARRPALVVFNLNHGMVSRALSSCRDSEPLPVQVRELEFNTEHTATLAGKVALREFLTGLAREENA